MPFEIFRNTTTFFFEIHWIAYIFLKEHLHWLDMLAIPLTIVGIVFFAQPSFLGFSETNYDPEAYLGMFFAILSSILAASCFNIIRKIGKSAHYTVTVFYYSFTGMLIIGIIIALTTGFTFPCQVRFQSQLQWQPVILHHGDHTALLKISKI